MDKNKKMQIDNNFGTVGNANINKYERIQENQQGRLGAVARTYNPGYMGESWFKANSGKELERPHFNQ